MFAKPYKLKSNNTLKNSEKKHLAQRIQTCFPGTSDEKVKEIVSVKSNTSCMKLILHSGDTVGVYVVDGTPMIIELEDRLVPTVCAMWKVPDLVPTIAIHTPVLSKIQGGAPLYAPGVVSDSLKGKRFNRGAILAVCTGDNYAAGLVGKAAVSSTDLARLPMGVCLETIHVFGDMLCKDVKFNKLERPKLAPPIFSDDTNIMTENLAQLNIQPIKEEWPSLVKENPAVPVVNEPQIIDDQKSQKDEKEKNDVDKDMDHNETFATECSDNEDDGIPSDMDGLLRWCLLSFLKHQATKVELPLKTNLFYKNYLMPLCPENHTLDVKKSSYKKMGKFLEAMQREGLVETREIEKGVDALVKLNPAHPLVRAHRTPRTAPAPTTVAHAPASPPVIRELYCVTAAVAAALAPHRKGTALSASEVRATLVEYVRARELTAPERRGAVVLDDALAQAANKRPQEVLKWEEIMTGVLGRMTPSTDMVFSDGTHKLIKSKLEPIKMQVATRSGNKKVTLVSNLEAFGYNLVELAQACQHGAAASCGVTRSSGAKADQLLLQGDQTHFIAKLLIEKYGLPKKFLEGADKALNKKK
ncbi:eukaryotic translation initiation factor 2D [Aricia agestis]|uniref:eukaryotic translation initiation factor 2D n=1 Tax=Aricia agestis TaxID=91739 RepID=UPI001C208CB8|nr:eukaryotic translation initiation factor 2D [Aricia agestis]